MNKRAKTPRIAIVGSRGIPAKYGGYETITQELATGLAKKNYQTYVSCESKSLRPQTYGQYKGVRLFYFPVIQSLRNLSEPFLYDLLSVIWSTLKADIIYMLGFESVPTLIIPRLLHKTVLLNVDGLEPGRPKFNALIKFFYRSFEKLTPHIANHIIVDSKTVGAYYRQNYNVSPTYIPNGGGTVVEAEPYPPETLNRYGLKKDQYYLVIARLEPDNNTELIIDGFCQSKSNKKLVVVGPLTKTSYVRRLLMKRSKNILFLGGIFETRLQRTLRYNCFAYIHGHEHGGTNPSLLEALSCSNRILSIDVPFNREVAEESALYFKKNAQDLKEKIQTLEKISNLATPNQAARKIFETKYSGEEGLTAFVQLINQITKTNK